MSTLATRYPGAALVTGASAGLGVAFAKHCASQGMDLVLVARRLERLVALAETLRRDHAVKVLVVQQDLVQPDAPQAIKDACDAAGVTVSLLINNAGFGSYGPFHESDLGAELAIVDVNCKAPVALTRLLLPGMVARRNGAVVFLASTASYQPAPMVATYCASKAFSRLLGETLHAELKPLGVDVLSLSPGYTATEFHQVAQVTRLPHKDLFRQPEQVVAACFKALGKQAAIIDRITPFQARINRWKARLFRYLGR